MLRILIGSLLLLSIPLIAEEQNPSKVPHAAMQKLAFMQGDWMSVTEYTADDGKNWQVVAQAPAKVEFRQKELMLAELPVDTSTPGFHMETYITYDQYRKVYRKAAIDDAWGLMDMYEGTWQGDKLILDNLKSGTFFPNGDGTWRAFKLTIEKGEVKRLIHVDKSDDGGKSWQPSFRVTYTREDQTAAALMPMMNGDCSEYSALKAETVKIDEQVSLNIYQDKDFVWLCYTYPEGSFGTLDLVIDTPKIEKAMNLHVSAQLGEWPADNPDASPDSADSDLWWAINGWMANNIWFNGYREVDGKQYAKWKNAPAREMQISKAHFGTGDWKLRFEIRSVKGSDGDMYNITYPDAESFYTLTAQ